MVWRKNVSYALILVVVRCSIWSMVIVNTNTWHIAKRNFMHFSGPFMRSVFLIYFSAEYINCIMANKIFFHFLKKASTQVCIVFCASCNVYCLVHLGQNGWYRRDNIYHLNGVNLWSKFLFTGYNFLQKKYRFRVQRKISVKVGSSFIFKKFLLLIKYKNLAASLPVCLPTW